MTAPVRMDDALYGYTPAQWRAAARSAYEALRANPNDAEARDQLDMARRVIGEHATRLGQRAQIAARADTEEATRVSPAMSAALGASQGMTFGLGDEAAAALQIPFSVFRKGMNFRRAYLNRRDADRALLAQAQASNPAAYFAGELAGGGASGVGGAAVVGRALPALPAAIAAAARPGATIAQQLGGAAASGAMAAPLGAAFGYGAGEEGPVADVGDAAMGGAAAGTLGVILGPIGANIARRRAVNVAREVETVNRGAASEYDVAAKRAAADFHESRAAQARVATQVAEETAPARIVSAQNQAQLSTLRVGEVQERAAQLTARGQTARARATDIPLDRAMKEDRAVLLAIRRAEAEARRAGSTTGATGVEARMRARLSQMGMSAADVETAVQRARNTVGNPLYVEPVQTSTAPAGQAPSTQRTAPVEPGITSSEVDAALVEGRAGLAAQRATPVPEGPVAIPTIIQPHAPGNAARAAYAQAEAAGLDPKAAAARAGGMARQTGPVAEDASLAAFRLLQSPPTLENQALLMQYLQPLNAQQRALVQRQLPTEWRQALGL